MRIFAIDPGNVQSAYCVMDDKFNLISFAKLENNDVLKKLNEQCPFVDLVVIERLASYGMSVGRDVFETCEWVGRFTQASSVPVEYVYRRDEKLYICHDSRAKDTNIRKALIERFAQFDFKNGRGTKKNPDYFYGVSKDCWAAIAVAVTHYDMKQDERMKETEHE